MSKAALHRIPPRFLQASLPAFENHQIPITFRTFQFFIFLHRSRIMYLPLCKNQGQNFRFYVFLLFSLWFPSSLYRNFLRFYSSQISDTIISNESKLSYILRYDLKVITRKKLICVLFKQETHNMRLKPRFHTENNNINQHDFSDTGKSFI